jgi:hypothetical protein
MPKIRMSDYQLYVTALRMFFILSAPDKYFLAIAWSIWMKGDNVPVAVRSGRSFGATAAKPYTYAPGWYDLINEAKNFFFSLQRDS